jgi:hypothetical protein
VSWKESNEPTVTPMPAPYMDLAPDEERMVTGGQLQVFGDLEGEYDSDVCDVLESYSLNIDHFTGRFGGYCQSL